MIANDLRALVTVALNFVRERTSESCTRLCALICCVTGCGCAIGTVWFAFLHPGRATTVTALVGITSALIAAGCVALLTRSKTEDGRRKTETACPGGES
jgi:hydroxyethylthiazole kinase-like sugar kinase family protein